MALWPSPPVITFFPISEFSYKLIRFLLHSYIVKSDNEIEIFLLFRHGMSQANLTDPCLDFIHTISEWNSEFQITVRKSKSCFRIGAVTEPQVKSIKSPSPPLNYSVLEVQGLVGFWLGSRKTLVGCSQFIVGTLADGSFQALCTLIQKYFFSIKGAEKFCQVRFLDY